MVRPDPRSDRASRELAAIARSNPAVAEALIESARVVERARITVARHDPCEFARYVLRDEKTGAPIANAPPHQRFHEILDRHPKAVIWSHIESGKTNQVTIARPLFDLARDRGCRVAVVSKSAPQARKFLRSIKGYIQRSRELHALAPGLRPSRDNWAVTAITVDRDGYAKDASVSALGVGTQFLGARLDRIYLDDVLGTSNTRTKRARDDTEEWYDVNLGGRLADDGRVAAVGTAWHVDDLYHRLAKRDGWTGHRFGVLDPRGRPTWPERWPLRRIRAWEREHGSIESARQLHVRAITDEERQFKSEWIDIAIANGDGIDLIEFLDPGDLPPGAFVVTGVDLAAKKKRVGALTVFWTILVYANGDRQLLHVRRGRFTAPAIRDIAIEVHERFGSILFVEDNGVQSWMRELIGERSAVPVWPFQTNANKWDPAYGVASIGAERELGKWIFPSDDGVVAPAIEPLIEGLDLFDPNAHTADDLMALWIAREGARHLTRRLGGGGAGRSVGVRVIGGVAADT